MKFPTEFEFHNITPWTEYLVFMHVIFESFINIYHTFAPFLFF
jgi:hypothetical protein